MKGSYQTIYLSQKDKEYLLEIIKYIKNNERGIWNPSYSGAIRYSLSKVIQQIKEGDKNAR